MAKEKSEMSKEERKALKAAKKEAKSSKPEGVTKSAKEDKKDKKEKTKLAERVLKEIQNEPAASTNGVKADESDEEEQIIVDKKGAVRPVGALVPFANPLADEKVGKKVFKSVKKGSSVLLCVFPKNFVLILLQRLSTGRSSEASRKSSKRCESRRPTIRHCRKGSWCWQRISARWMSSAISRYCVRITIYPTSTFRAERSWEWPGRRRDRHLWSLLEGMWGSQKMEKQKGKRNGKRPTHRW